MYNPLDKLSLAKSIEGELLSRPSVPLADPGAITGAGVYAIYYSGPFPAYAPLALKNKDGAFGAPIYVGKAMPKGGRKGTLEQDASKSTALRTRLTNHRKSLGEVSSLEVDDFHVRFLVVDLIWIPLGESMLIRSFAPPWNLVVEGFGINAPGKGRKDQRRSQWDTIHPGRAIAEKRPPNGLTPDEILEKISRHFRGEYVPPPAETDEDGEED
jgi:hypothetical protein